MTFMEFFAPPVAPAALFLLPCIDLQYITCQLFYFKVQESPTHTMFSLQLNAHTRRETQFRFFLWKCKKHTAWSDWSHQSVHLDVPVFDVGARLAKFPLSSLPKTESSPLKCLRQLLALAPNTRDKYGWRQQEDPTFCCMKEKKIIGGYIRVGTILAKVNTTSPMSCVQPNSPDRFILSLFICLLIKAVSVMSLSVDCLFASLLRFSVGLHSVACSPFCCRNHT